MIDAAADELYGAVRVAGKVGKKALKEGFKGAKTGIKAINELSELAIQNPVLIRVGNNLQKQHEATMQGMANSARRARGSILATGNNYRKRHMTAGSLVTTHSPGTNTGTTTTVPMQRVFTHVVHRKGGDIIRYFSAAGIEISAKQAKRLTSGAPLPTADTNEPYNNVRGVVNPIVPNPLGTQRRQGNPIGEITKACNPLGAIKRVCNPVVDISRVATLSMLVFRR